MATGTILVEVTRYNELLPIANAQVLIRSEETGASMRLTTNSSGRTRIIEVPAPPRQNSLSPNMPSSMEPFFSYTVETRATGYLSVHIEGVQVFEGIESIVPVHMIPAIPGPDEIAVPVAAIARRIEQFPESIPGNEVVIEIPKTAVLNESPRQQPGPPDPETRQQASQRENAQTQQRSAARQPQQNRGRAAPQPGAGNQRARNGTQGRQQPVNGGRNGAPGPAGPQGLVGPPGQSSQSGMQGRLGNSLGQSLRPADAEEEPSRPVAAMAEYHAQPRALQAVYIPEGIIVHLGTPSSDARNVYVSFVDYIKNVACSEIFPTWPESALRANIHAQIGFVLNRVFTEWYPSRGYDFNITNSTAYDQCFVEGRNIFENISQLVDEIFNVYPRRAGRLEPLFSSYCNGTTATCAGLSQWGTVTLAERGYTPLQILQYYYGADVELVAATDIQGIEGSYPGYILRRGMRGEYVRLLQRQLLRVRRNFPYIPAISSATGYFGPETEAAVRAFQEIFDLQVDGLVGVATWYALQRIYAAVTNLGEIQSEGIPLPGAIVPYPGRPLRMGMRGEDVRTLQRYLNDLSTVYGTLPGLTVDGHFGAQTQAAVLALQRQFDLLADGVVGPGTWNTLMIVWDNAF